MVRWKFKTFIIIYSAILITLVVLVCRYVWNGLDGYQKDYDKELSGSDPVKVMDSFIKEFDMDYLKDIVENDSAIYLTEFEEINVVMKLYENEFSDAKFFFREETEYSNNQQKVYAVVDENNSKLVSVILTAGERTENFGFQTWKVAEVLLDKYYETQCDIVLRVSDKSVVTVNGIVITDGEKYASVEDENFDNVFSDAIKKYTGGYEKYKYYKLTNLYEIPEIVVTNNGNTIEPEIAADGTYNYEKFEDEAFVEAIKPSVILAESAYADYVAKFKKFEELAPYLMEGSDFYDQAVKVQDFLEFINRPKNVTYSGWNITSVKKYGEDKFTCDLSYMQKVSYGGVVREYSNTTRALFIKEGEIWKIAYQKNK